MKSNYGFNHMNNKQIENKGILSQATDNFYAYFSPQSRGYHYLCAILLKYG